MGHENSILYVAPQRSLNGGPRATFVRSQYLDALNLVGLEPRVLPVGTKYEATQRALTSSRGILFVGGSDINPHLYGQEPLPTTEDPDHMRDVFELQILKAALHLGIPILGICRGAQVLAVGNGAQLVQNVEGHSTIPSLYDNLQLEGAHHEVWIQPDSLVGLALINQQGVMFTHWNSMHHQAIHPGKLPLNLRVSAKSQGDEVIEAIELKDQAFAVGIQAHPEADLNHMSGIFKAFAKAVRGRN